MGKIQEKAKRQLRSVLRKGVPCMFPLDGIDEWVQKQAM